MFHNPFSFSGRIRRLEYGFSYLLFIGVYIFFSLIISETASDQLSDLSLLLLLPGYWFILAQGAKRCHDLGNSGFFQLIPFYGFVMLFSEGKRAPNKYGQDPKDQSAPKPSRDPISLLVNIPNDNSLDRIAIELITIALLNTILVVVIEEFLEGFALVSNLMLFTSIICCYLALLYFSGNGRDLSNFKPFYLRHRIAYILLLYLFISLYGYVFQNDGFSFEDYIIEIFMLLIFLSFTFISFRIYGRIFRKIKE